MRAGGCPDDELLRAQRGELSLIERRTLEAHLASCALCRMSAALRRAVGPLPPPDDEDEALASRLLARQPLPVADDVPRPLVRPVRLMALPLRSPRRWGRALALAASFLLLAGVASAAYWTVHGKPTNRSVPPATPSPTPVMPTTPRIITPLPIVAPAVERAPLSAPIVAATPGASPPSSPLVPSASRVGPMAGLTPETLLRQANDARRARRFDQAARLYRGLQGRFPSSREAVLSRLSLGDLLLSQGAFAEALEQFRAYARTPGDLAELGEEALLGEARALAALGRPDEERAVWRAFASRFPQSEYSWRARQGLRELDGGAP